MKNFAQQLHVYRTYRMDLGAPRVKLGLLLHDAATHMPDDRNVLPAQAAQLHHLLGQVAATNVHRTPCLVFDLADAYGNCSAQNFLPLTHDPLGQHMFQTQKLTCLQQLCIGRYLGNQPFLRRNWNDLRLRQAKNLG